MKVGVTWHETGRAGMGRVGWDGSVRDGSGRDGSGGDGSMVVIGRAVMVGW
jgi:hypothetical protein